MLLTERGFDVVRDVGTGVEAVEAAQDIQPDLIVLDLDMPQMDGLKATRLIKVALPDVPIIILTGSEREGNLFEAVRSGALGYVLKTMPSDALVQQIEAAGRGEIALDARLATKVLAEFSRSVATSRRLRNSPPRTSHGCPMTQTIFTLRGADGSGTSCSGAARRWRNQQRDCYDARGERKHREIPSREPFAEAPRQQPGQVVAWAMRQDWYRRSTK